MLKFLFKYWKWIGGVVICLGFYAMGNWIPINALRPEIKQEQREYYTLLNSILYTFITLCAVLVALFKDDFREYWKCPKVVFLNPKNSTIEITEEEDSSGLGDAVIQATKYITRIEVQNIGNLPAINCEVYLDKLEFREKNSSIYQFIETTGIPMEWNANGIKSIIIPPGGKKLIHLVEINAPTKLSLPNDPQTHQPPTLIIGGIKNRGEDTKGTWLATFTLYSQNHRPTDFQLEIEWNGVWKKRLMEMASQFKVEITGNKK
jgi:hypothetical protein